MRLNTVENGRKTLASIVRRYEKGLIPEQEARTLRYLMDGLLAWFRLEKDIQLEKRIEALEREGAK